MQCIRFMCIFIVSVFCVSSFAVAGSKYPDFIQVIEDSKDAVVNIKIEADEGVFNDGLSNINLLEKLFGGQDDSMAHVPAQEFPVSVGSGFVIQSNGVIVTNYHVVANAKRIVVKLNDRREFDAEILGYDEASDIALLKINANDLKQLSLGDSSELKIGQWVMGIGSPFGFDHTVTAGIVSAKDRQLPNSNYVNFIQTDVAINPGNSGGPLLNTAGEVVGINSQIMTSTGASAGLSFSIPVNTLRFVANHLITHGTVSRGWLGVKFSDVDVDLADSVGLKFPRGALITKVLNDSPADKYGLQADDIILAINGNDLKTARMLPPLVAESIAKDPASFTILRDKAQQTIRVRLGSITGDTRNLYAE